MTSEPSTSQISKLKGREQVAEGTMAFYFERPGGFQFRAGQAIDVTCLAPRKQTPQETSALFPSPAPRLKTG
jgi:hypothetical protein